MRNELRMTALTVLALAAAMPVTLTARTLEVGPTREYRTIQSAASVAQAGDVVLIDPGVYREWVKPANAGTKDAPITYRARQKGTVVITGADVITGWTRRADGLWEVTLPYDGFGGFNPFTDFISGNWYFPPKGVRNPRTMLFRGREKMVFCETPADFGQGHRCKTYLFNVAGITAGGKVIAGGSATVKAGAAKPDGDTPWGREMGFITNGQVLTYPDFPKTDTFTLHYSSIKDNGCLTFHDGTPDGERLGSCVLEAQEGWRNYADLPVKLAKAPASGTLAVVCSFRPDYGRRIPVGYFALQKGMATGKVIADFKDDPNDGRTELAVRPCCFYPIREGRDYQRLEGLTFRDAGPNWAEPHAEQLGLVGTHWSRGWVIEDCEVSGSPCAGITLGKHGDEFDGYGNSDSQRYTEAIARAIAHGIDKVGHHAVRRCRIRDCGQAGVCGSLGAPFSTIERCDIGYCFWDDENNYHGCEQACIKIHAAVDVVIADNELHHTYHSGGAIWLDWMAQGARVTRNLIHHAIFPADGWRAGIFVEVGHGPTIIENNVILAREGLTFRGTQSVACIGNVISGNIWAGGDSRRTPIWEPHSVKLREMLNDCGAGGFRFINNVMAAEPPTDGMKYPNVVEDNVIVPPERWHVANGDYTIDWAEKPDASRFRTVDTDRLGVSELGRQPYENRDGSKYVWDPTASKILSK